MVFDAALVDEVDKVVTEILQDCEQFAYGYLVEDTIPQSVGQHLRQKFERYLDGCTEDSEETRCMKEELFDWHLRYLLPCMAVLYFVHTGESEMCLGLCSLCFKYRVCWGFECQACGWGKKLLH